MTQVTLDRKVAEELLNTKLRFLQDETRKILRRWDYRSAEKFLQDARDGTIVEAEDDAITLRHLLDQLEEFHALKRDWSKK